MNLFLAKRDKSRAVLKKHLPQRIDTTLRTLSRRSSRAAFARLARLHLFTTSFGNHGRECRPCEWHRKRKKYRQNESQCPEPPHGNSVRQYRAMSIPLRKRRRRSSRVDECQIIEGISTRNRVGLLRSCSTECGFSPRSACGRLVSTMLATRLDTPSAHVNGGVHRIPAFARYLL